LFFEFFFGFLPLHRPEQQFESLPLHLAPTALQLKRRSMVTWEAAGSSAKPSRAAAAARPAAASAWNASRLDRRRPTVFARESKRLPSMKNRPPRYARYAIERVSLGIGETSGPVGAEHQTREPAASNSIRPE
jgi:hypothetical protein